MEPVLRIQSTAMPSHGETLIRCESFPQVSSGETVFNADDLQKFFSEAMS